MKNIEIIMDLDFTLDYTDYLYGESLSAWITFHRYGMAVEWQLLTIKTEDLWVKLSSKKMWACVAAREISERV